MVARRKSWNLTETWGRCPGYERLLKDVSEFLLTAFFNFHSLNSGHHPTVCRWIHVSARLYSTRGHGRTRTLTVGEICSASEPADTSGRATTGVESPQPRWLQAWPSVVFLLLKDGKDAKQSRERKTVMFYRLRFLCGKNFPYVIYGELFWKQEHEVEIYMMMVIASQKFSGAVNHSRLMSLFRTSVLHWTHFLCKAVNKSFLWPRLWLGSWKRSGTWFIFWSSFTLEFLGL